MIRNKLYYQLKPFLSWPLRTALRRWWSRSRRAAYGHVWPIDAAAGVSPPCWPGWPNGKKFAFVLTHDVEGSKGLGRVEQLMKLELEHGFRSSFNFVPENEYRVPDALRNTLDQAGFEVGVHGLKHDGRLYASKSIFAEKASHIRNYIQQWSAAGFRSPLMQHNLAWLHHLGVEYDASTFDTDPFEPEPDGFRTIFPFWVPSKNGGGYVELPYTLPQDYTLYVILRESNIDIWKKKLDWVVENQGMVLLNTHPDYMSFEAGRWGRDEFPISYYEELLSYVRDKYEGMYWAALPREVSRFYCASIPHAERNTRRRVCMLAYTDYESDNRVRRYAETLAKRGDQVDVIAYASGGTPSGPAILNGVNVHRIQRRDTSEVSMWSYAWRLLRFLYVSSVFLKRRHKEVRYDLIHIHNIPDFLVFSAWYPKWAGTKVILDVHDLVPELFVNKFKAGVGSVIVSALKIIERWSCRFVDHVIVSNHLWHETLVSRSAAADRCSVFLNHVDESVFYRRPRTRTDGKFIILFPGSLQWHQGLDIAIQAFSLLKDRLPTAEFHIYGGGPMKRPLMRLVASLGLVDRVKFCGGASLDAIADVIANADMGVVPKRADSFGNEAYSTKIMEFMSQGVPVVASRTKIDEFYFDDSTVQFFAAGDHEAMSRAMLEVIENGERRAELVRNGYQYAERQGWACNKERYIQLVDSLLTETFDDVSGAVPTKVAPNIN